jgi:hypothetical protein
MTLSREIVAGVLLVGYVVCLPLLLRGLRDIDRIPRRVWSYSGFTNRRAWRNGLIGGYLIGGWPSAIGIFAWRHGNTRAALRDEWKLLIEEKRRRHEIVLADHEEHDQPVA